MQNSVSKLTAEQRAANLRVGAILFVIVAGFFLASIFNKVFFG